jgi:hypothetical protein
MEPVVVEEALRAPLVPPIELSVSDLYQELKSKSELEALLPYTEELESHLQIIEQPLVNYIRSGEAFQDPAPLALETLGSISGMLTQMLGIATAIYSRACAILLNESATYVRNATAEMKAKRDYVDRLIKLTERTIDSIKKDMEPTKRRG